MSLGQGARVAALFLIAACGGTAKPDSSSITAPARSGAPSEIALIPRPRSLTLTRGAFTITPSTPIVADPSPEARAAATLLARWLGLQVDVGSERRPGAIVLERTASSAPDRDPAHDVPTTTASEAYTLEVSSSGARIRASTAAGLRYGAETLADLAGVNRLRLTRESDRERERGTRLVPLVTIRDEPRFAFRAMHLDVARHFFDVAAVRRYLDLLALYRFNVFHWHLSDDQGFRFEVKSRPELTAVGGTDGFFTQRDVADVVAYARERGITVIPEIEMPGHSRAILAAHPELSCTGKKQDVPRTWGVFDDVLCAGNEATYALLEAVLREVAAVFPSRLVHVGGDEVPPDRWSECPKCRALMQASHVDAPGLEAVFLRRIGDILDRLGRRMVVWDEALTEPGAAFPLPESALVVAWQSQARGRSAALAGHDVVLAPYDQTYFNFQQAHGDVEPGHKGYLPWSKVRVFDPVPNDLSPAAARHVLGGEGALWTEHVETPEDIETLVMPRMAALAEALWSGIAVPEPDFVARWNRQLPALDAAGVHYFVEPPELGRAKTVFLDTAPVTMSASRLYPGSVMRFTEDGTLPAAGSPIYESPFSLHETKTIAAGVFLGSGRMSPAVRATFTKEKPRPPVTLQHPTPGALYRYVEGDFHAAPDADALPAKAHGTAASLRLADVKAAIGPAMRKEQYALSLRAFVRVPRDGIYRFIARADDGIVILIDGERTVVDDGEHGPRESDGQIALAAGFHEIAVSFFQAGGAATLEVSVEGPGLARQPVEPFRTGAR